MPPCLTLSIIRYGLKVKWGIPVKGVAPSPTPWCCSYQKGSLQVTLDYGRQLYLLTYIVDKILENLKYALLLILHLPLKNTEGLFKQHKLVYITFFLNDTKK